PFPLDRHVGAEEARRRVAVGGAGELRHQALAVLAPARHLEALPGPGAPDQPLVVAEQRGRRLRVGAYPDPAAHPVKTGDATEDHRVAALAAGRGRGRHSRLPARTRRRRRRPASQAAVVRAALREALIRAATLSVGLAPTLSQ